MKNLFIRLFNLKHECEFDEVEVILEGCKDTLHGILESQGTTMVGWDVVKDWSPRCPVCHRKFSSYHTPK